MKVAIIMGSASDMPVMEGAIKILQEFGVETGNIVSAHRTPSYMIRFATAAHKRYRRNYHRLVVLHTFQVWSLLLVLFL